MMQAALLALHSLFFYGSGLVTVVRVHHHFNDLENDRRTNNVSNWHIFAASTGTYLSQTSDIRSIFYV